jgi:hypothetical protein
VKLSEQVVRRLLDESPDALVAVVDDQEIAFANRAAEDLFGCSVDELLGARLELLASTDTGGLGTLEPPAGEADPPTSIAGVTRTLVLRGKDCSYFTGKVNVSELDDGLGGRILLVAVRDLGRPIGVDTERQRRVPPTHHAVDDRLEWLGRLSCGIAHDLNNLLGVILNYATLLDDHVVDPEDRADLKEIRSAAERTIQLSRRLGAFAVSGDSAQRPLEVNGVISDTMARLSGSIGENIDLRLELAPSPLFVGVGRGQFDRVITELVANACEAMPDGGRLTITAAAASYQPAASDRDLPERADVVVQVEDEGPGMAPEALSRAFEPLFTTKPRGDGAGLGLTLVYDIVFQCQGDVSIESTPGAGTTVTVVMPSSSRMD